MPQIKRSATSLLSLIQAGLNIPEAKMKVHYPNHGADILASVEATHFWFVSRRTLVRDILLPRLAQSHSGFSSVRGADIGCGTGYTAVWFSELGIPTVGLDVHSGFSVFQSAGKGAGFLAGDLLSIEPAAEFDFVLLLDVLEHIEDDGAFLRHSSKLLKPGGVMLISVPAFQSLWSSADEQFGHLRRYVKEDFSLERLGENLFLEYSTYFFASTLPLYFASRVLRSKTSEFKSDASEFAPPPVVNSTLKSLLVAERFLTRLFPMPFGSSLFLLLRKGANVI